MLLHISISAGITADLFAVFFRDNLSFLSPGKRKPKSAGYGFLWSVHQGSVFPSNTVNVFAIILFVFTFVHIFPIGYIKNIP